MGPTATTLPGSAAPLNTVGARVSLATGLNRPSPATLTHPELPRPALTSCTAPQKHPAPTAQSPIQIILEVVASLDPDLPAATVISAAHDVTSRAGQRRQLAWALSDQPELLTGAGALAKAHRDYLAGRGIKAAIPIKDDQAAARRKKGPRGGRPPSFDRERYRVRHTVERAINKLRNHRATATRYEKRDFIYRGTIAVTSIWIWLHNPTQTRSPNTPYGEHGDNYWRAR